MKQFIPNESEKRTILEQHSKYRNILLEKLGKKINNNLVEQVTGPGAPSFIGEYSIDKVMEMCVAPNIRAVKTNFKGQLAIKVIGAGQDNVKIFTNEPNAQLGGYTKYVLNTAETQILKTTNWDCPALYAKSQEIVNKTQSSEGFKTAEELGDTPENLNNPKMYQSKVVNGVKLYKSVFSSGVTGGLTKDQTDYIAANKKPGGKTWNEMSVEERKTWRKSLLSPKSEGIFPEDFYIYYPQDIQSQDDVSTEFSNASNELNVKSKKDCKDAIEKFYDAWADKKWNIKQSAFEPMKVKVQACVDQHTYGGIFSGLDEKIDALRGRGKGKRVSSYGADAKFRLN
jgi:hypothetical protein